MRKGRKEMDGNLLFSSFSVVIVEKLKFIKK